MLTLILCTLAFADVPSPEAPDTSCRCSTGAERAAAPLSLGVLLVAVLRRRR